MELQLPKKVRVGEKWYSVEVVEAMADKNDMGRVFYQERKIRIGRKTSHGVPFKMAAIKETFWHELVHAILEDMGEHRLNNRESFVEEFSNRLTKAINSARF
jgi:hypothetical protein